MTVVGPADIAFPGVLAPTRAEFTMSHGAFPSTGFLECVAQPTRIASLGDLILACDGNVVRIRNCSVVQSRADRTDQGTFVTLSLRDRRQFWLDQHVSGVYNVRDEAGFLDRATEKSPQDMARMLFALLGETTADVSELPDDSRPAVNWDYANVAQELQTLCDGLGCRIVLQLNNAVKIVRLHRGQNLPDNAYSLSVASDIAPPPVPGALLLVGDAIRYEVMLPMEAVGIDIDGSIKPVNDLSYRPADGWETEYWSEMASISDVQTTRPDGSRVSRRQCALASVGKMYRIENGPLKLPGRDRGTVLRRQILPIGNTLIDTYTDSDGRKYPKPAFVSGEWYYENRAPYANTSAGERIPTAFGPDDDEISFSIDTERGLVQFSKPILRLTEQDDRVEFPKLFLHTTITVQEADTRAVRRYTRREQLSALPTERTLLQPDVQYAIRGQYNTSGEVQGFDDNRLEIDFQADYYIREAISQLAAVPAFDVPYAGLQLIDVDGAIQQVTWSVGDGASTRASRGVEHSSVVPAYREYVEASDRARDAQQIKLSEAESRRARRKRLS